MANNKNFSIREKILDRYLRSSQGYTREQLQKYINDEMERRGLPSVSSRCTILSDMTEIENKYHIVIEKNRKGRQLYYKYQGDFSIYNDSLTDEDYQKINSALDIVRRYQGIPQFGWIDELSARLDLTLKKIITPIIGFEDAMSNTGMEYFTTIFHAISNKLSINITYQPFSQTEAFSSTVYPYFLKQYNNRWFMLCMEEGHDTITNFALDRITEISRSNKPYCDSPEDCSHYFDDIIGVSRPNNGVKQHVEFFVTKKQAPYVKTKPLHKSQQWIRDDQNGSYFSIDVIPNYEMEQELLQLCERLVVISPKELRDKLKQRIEENLNNYELVQID